jgi:hypothetical protein
MKWYSWLALAVGLALLVIFVRIRSTEAQTVGVTMVWTAPGDDGVIGRAAQYDLRYSQAAISGTDTLTWWNAAVQATGEPLPSVSGATDSLRVLGLQPSARYYALVKAADEVPNWSGYSNVAVVDTPDLVPPSRILDLRVR